MASGNILIDYTKWLIKWALIIFISVIVLIALLIGYSSFANWWKNDRHIKNVIVKVVNESSNFTEQIVSSYAIDEALRRGLITKEEADLKHLTRKEKVLELELSCDPDFPIFVSFVNNSSKTIKDIEIDIEATLPGHSTNILNWSAEAKYDRIVPPGEGWGQCWSFPFKDEYLSNSDLKKAIYTGRATYVHFK